MIALKLFGTQQQNQHTAWKNGWKLLNPFFSSFACYLVENACACSVVSNLALMDCSLLGYSAREIF